MPSPKHSQPVMRGAALSRLLLGSSALLLASALPAFAQVTIDDERTTPISTGSAGGTDTPDDIVIGSGGSVVINTPGPAVTVDSDNTVTNEGRIQISDVDNATAVELQGGANRGFTNSGQIIVDEDFPEANTDDDPIADTPAASGTGRRGILVSGASPFEGNITLEQASSILVEGNESYGIDLSNTPVGAGLDGTLSNSGSINLRGDNGAAVRIASGVTGDVINNGSIDVFGEGSAAFDIGAEIQGGFRNSGSISNNGYRFSTRAPFNPDLSFDRLDLGVEDLAQAGSAISVSADIGEGIGLLNRFETVVDADGNPVLDDDGNEQQVLVSSSRINQFGSAAAILIDGNGTPISIGRVATITDPADPDFDEDLLYAFVQQGSLITAGVYNDFDATTLEVVDATLDGGIRNSGTMTATTFVGSVAPPADSEIDFGTGLARVIVLGDNAIAEELNNSGIIIATASEAVDEFFFDSANVIAPRRVEAVALDIAATASMETLTNDGILSAILIGRNGEATVVRDASGTLSNVVNRGTLAAVGNNSDSNGLEETDFTLIALDLSNNTTGVSILQEQLPDDNPDDDITPRTPSISGDILLGSGDDTLIATAGGIAGDVDFGAGDDRLALSGTELTGDIRNSGGLEITVENGSTLALRTAAPIDITSASFDDTSTFRPVIDGQLGTSSTLNATGAISFASGTVINPILNNLINSDTAGAGGTGFSIASSSDLTVGDLAALNASDDGSFLFNTFYSVEGNDLVVTFDLRGAEDLGLDAAQIGTDTSVFNATLQALQLNNELGNEVANLGTASEFYAAYNQLLPEFAAAARQFVVANSDGAVGAVGNHLDSARRSPEKPGGAWIQEFAYFADRDLAGLSEQYRGEGFGFTGGLDTAIGPFHSVGVNFGFASTEIEDVVGQDEPLDVTTILAGLYAGWASGKLGIDAYVGGGYNDFEQSRRVRVNDFTGVAEGDWNGTHLAGTLRAGYDIDLGSRFWARPVVSLDYLRLTESAYEETGTAGVALAVDKRTSELGAVSGILNFGAVFEGKRTWIRPSLRVGYRNEFLSDPVLTDYRFLGVANPQLAQTISSEFPDAGLLVGFSVAAGSQYSSIGFDFDSDIRDGFIRHTGRVVVRLLF